MQYIHILHSVCGAAADIGIRIIQSCQNHLSVPAATSNKQYVLKSSSATHLLLIVSVDNRLTILAGRGDVDISRHESECAPPKPFAISSRSGEYSESSLLSRSSWGRLFADWMGDETSTMESVSRSPFIRFGGSDIIEDDSDMLSP